jgi:hypothetical protein
MLLLGNIGQQLDIQDQRDEIRRLRGIVSSGRQRGGGSEKTERLERELDETRLYVAVLVRLLVSKGVATQKEIRALVEAIDAEDGAADGKSGGLGG